ncbi:OLC1v1014946C1 [Oldenlandia corymbosa var. corymbosa]|uniref:OLC1v1014946C1 n=1 Tax=Oldenlandia corymbosa var. corymbosa TaxID=529605 RepID=A0AAV1E2D5_OLDCO|nr:OLC1v1014946C1 [Oldenlandia corymbosa var. corymbosa]
MASEVVRKADENNLSLVREQTRENEGAFVKLLMEIEELKGKAEAMEYVVDAVAVQKQIQELTEKIEVKDSAEELLQSLNVKHRQAYAELMDARKELILVRVS